MKICNNCKIEKELIEFKKQLENKDGYTGKCKICISEYNKQYSLNNKEKQKEYRLRNKEKAKEYNEIFKLKNKDYHKIYRLSNKEILKQKGKKYSLDKEYQKEYRLNNKEKAKEYHLYYNINNKEKRNKYLRNKRLINPLFKLSSNIRNNINDAFKRQGFTKKSRTHQILGCSFEEFKQHLQIQFTKGMNWENAGKWHLDHIYPVSLAKDEEELIRLNHYTNFQPLWAIDNLKKSNKIIDNKQLKLL